MDITIQQELGETKGRFYILADGRDLGEMTFVFAGSDKIIIDHTLVSDELKGQGAGKKLLDATVAWVREKGLKIIPICPFAKAVMTKNPEKYQDVLA
jgi:uncharacterized protein